MNRYGFHFDYYFKTKQSLFIFSVSDKAIYPITNNDFVSQYRS